MAGTGGKSPAQTSRNRNAPGAGRLGRDMQNLYQEVFALLLSKIESKATDSNRTNTASSANIPVPADRLLMIDPSSMRLVVAKPR